MTEWHAGTRISWTQTDIATKDFRLGDVASLRWEKEGGSLATGDVSGAFWTLKRVGVFHPKITIRRRGADHDEATISIAVGGSASIDFADGERYTLASNLWRGEWTWRSPSGERLILTRREFGMDQRAGEVEVLKSALQTMHLPLLAVAAWYLIVMLGEDSAMSDGPVR